jgi:hypothetical protein
VAINVHVQGAADALISGRAVYGEVHAASTAFRAREDDAARFVILAGGIVRQVAELERRSYQTIDCRGVARAQL